MKWWRAGVALAAVLIVVVVARGSSPIVFLPDRDRPGQAPNSQQGVIDTQMQVVLPDLVAVPFVAFLVVLAALVLFGLLGIVLAIELPRLRRKRGVRGVEITGEQIDNLPSSVQRVEKALQEFTEHPNRPPRDAVIAAWLALEEAQPRKPNQTPTEFTNGLGVDAAILRDLYQRVRFGHEDVTEGQANQAKEELGRIIRELA